MASLGRFAAHRHPAGRRRRSRRAARNDRIAVYPAEPRFPLDYRVLLDVREFEGTRGGSIRLRANWTVVARDGKAVAVEATQIEQPVTSPSWQDLVAAHSAALGTMTRQIATRVAALPRR